MSVPTCSHYLSSLSLFGFCSAVVLDLDLPEGEGHKMGSTKHLDAAADAECCCFFLP